MCKVLDGDTELHNISSAIATTVVKKVFQAIEIQPNRTYNGHHFFGLHRQDVKMLQVNSTETIKLKDLDQNIKGTISVSLVEMQIGLEYCHLVYPMMIQNMK